jgi:methylenetetrahydrofolate dehydrogenase (NADP+) / methenyltetrahydrofolate cyclohydrolase
VRIDGKAIAASINEDLKKKVALLKSRNITPHLAVILVGDDAASHAYVGQKQKKGEDIGMLVTVHTFTQEVTEKQLYEEIQALNADPLVHGIVIQQPLPSHIDVQKLVESTYPKKDVDGFHKDSPFTPPIAEAAIKILEQIHSFEKTMDHFVVWLQKKTIAVLGKGETGGAPIIEKLQNMEISIDVIDSKTDNRREILQNAEIVISCVGKPHILRGQDLKKDVILIGVGMHRGEDGKLHGDYEEDEIKNVARYYTPVPGGIGPVNVAMLLNNVLLAADH